MGVGSRARSCLTWGARVCGFLPEVVGSCSRSCGWNTDHYEEDKQQGVTGTGQESLETWRIREEQQSMLKLLQRRREGLEKSLRGKKEAEEHAQ